MTRAEVTLHCSSCAWRWTGPAHEASHHSDIHELIHRGGVFTPAVTECAYGCGWRYVGTLAKGRSHRQAHEEAAHPTQAGVAADVCSHHGCDEPADVAGRCFYHARDVAADAPPLPETEEEVVPEDRQCKVEGCAGEALDRRGMYAGLCADHKRERQETRRADAGAWTPERAIAAIKAFTDVHDRVPSTLDDDWNRGDEYPSLSTIKRLFGNLGNAIRAAGLEPIGRGNRAPTSGSAPSLEEPKQEEAVKPPPVADPPRRRAANGNGRGNLAALAGRVDELQVSLRNARTILDEVERELSEALDELEQEISTLRPPTGEPTPA